MRNDIRNIYQLLAFQASPTVACTAVPAATPTGPYQVAAEINRAAMAVVETYFRWSERAAQRRGLAALDDRLLADIGIDRAAAAQESRKPFWQS